MAKSRGMIGNDPRATANMPQEIKYDKWPEVEGGINTTMDDTITGANEQMNEDLRMARKSLKPTKY